MASRGFPDFAVLAAAVFVAGTVSSPLVGPDSGGSHTLHSKTETTPSPTDSAGSGHPEYIAYVLVPVFFIMGSSVSSSATCLRRKAIVVLQKLSKMRRRKRLKR